MEKTLPEAHAVAFTNYKRTDGFEVSITLRGDNGTEVLERLGKAIEQIKADGGTPVTRSAKAGYPQKVVEYVEGEVCPLDGGRLVKPQPGSKAPIKCENNKWNAMLKKSEGCAFVKWDN